MNQLDVYYRALLNYRKLTGTNRECTALRSAIAAANAEQDRIEVKRAFCSIEEDWVDAIESGLVYIEKAIKQERQFIRSNGEVVPIEKVKRISKETTQHLAKHSNLITKYQEGEDIVPDKLYMTERLNDYAVYENRFLYMLLCYLRDFVTLRYNDILDLTHKYDAEIKINKTVSTGKEKLDYTLYMKDVRKEDPYLKENNPAREIIDRIDLILKAILAFLATPLMSEVSKAPLLKPPITKTNVLKMNNDFKGAVALYDFVIFYDKPGYTVEERVTTISPFGDELADEMAEAGCLVSFLAYEYGLGMKQELKESYCREEDRLKAEKVAERAQRIAAMKKKLEKTGEGLEDYALTLEKQIRALEAESARADALSEEIAEHKEKELRLQEGIDRLEEEVKRIKEVLEDERHNHFNELENMKTAHEEEMHTLIVKHEEQLGRIAEERRVEAEKYAQQIKDARDRAREKVAEINAECNARVQKAEQEAADSRRAYLQLVEDKRIAEARVKALGGVDRDYIDKESFNELEREYNAFTRIYKEQWVKAKKNIRKRILSKENIRGQKEQDKDSD